MAAHRRVPAEIDFRTANVARMYDYCLGGKNNFAVDRAAAEEVLAAMPQVHAVARENRQFLRRVVRFLAQDAGVRQFLDIGSGLPTQANVHEVAQACAPAARVVYVDHDPVVISHARALLTSANTVAVLADMRRPEEILEHPETRRLIDFDQPVAVLFLSVLHFISDAEESHGLVARFREAIAPGSYVAVSQVTKASHLQELPKAVEAYEEGKAAAVSVRSHEQILRFFEGLELVEPGLVFVTQWRSEWPDLTEKAELQLLLGGVGRKN